MTNKNDKAAAAGPAAPDVPQRPTAPGRVKGNKESFLTPKLWSGMTVSAWFGLLARNRFNVGVTRIPMALIIVIFAVGNSCMRFLQALIYSRRIARTEIKEHPVFVIGHWRSGTTLLHELFACDPRHTFPTTYQCFSPNHFLLSEWIVTRLFFFVLPEKRLQDNVPLRWDRPQEDEFAMFNLGLRSPFLTVAFPNHPPQDQEFFDFEGAPTDLVDRWRSEFKRFLTMITYRTNKRIVLKSPQHTCRIHTLLDIFPDARFVYIVRDPYEVFPSSVKLWKLLYYSQGLHIPRYDGLEEFVLEQMSRLHRTVENTRQLIPHGRFCEIRYEQLIADPIGQLRRAYDELELGDFAETLPAVQQYMSDFADYRANQYELTPEEQALVGSRLADFIDQYEYGRSG